MPKSSPQVEIYGQIDELNAWMGLLAAEAGIPDVCRFLTDIQRDLFKIGGFYSFDFSEGKPYPYPFMDFDCEIIINHEKCNFKTHLPRKS